MSPTERVRAALRAQGIEREILEFEHSTHTAAQAARAVGATLGQIVKSLVLRGRLSQQPYLILVAGDHRANLDLLRRVIGEELEQPPPEWVEAVTGFPVGGVAPIGYLSPIRTLLDPALLQRNPLWAAAGSSRSVFALSPEELWALTQAEVLPEV